MRVRHNILYNTLMLIGLVLGFPLIVPIVLTTEKRRKTLLQRLGLAGLPESIGQRRLHGARDRPIWVHALSVGEVISAVPLPIDSIKIGYITKVRQKFQEGDQIHQFKLD